MELVDLYLSILMEINIIKECWQELKNFEEGLKWMVNSGYLVEGIDGGMQFVIEEEEDIEIWV